MFEVSSMVPESFFKWCFTNRALCKDSVILLHIQYSSCQVEHYCCIENFIMERIYTDYSNKSISIPLWNEYKIQLISKVENVLKRMSVKNGLYLELRELCFVYCILYMYCSLSENFLFVGTHVAKYIRVVFATFVSRYI